MSRPSGHPHQPALPGRLAATGTLAPAGEAGRLLPQPDPALEKVLLTLDGGTWKTGDAFQGTQIFGGTGSGKSTGSGARLALALLDAGFGGLVLTAKADEAASWRRYARDTGRLEDIVEISARDECCFNILEYEFYQGGGLTSNIVSLLIGAMSTGDGAVSTSEPYWTEALREMLIHAVDLAVFASMATTWQQTGRVEGARPELRLGHLVRLIRSAPQSLAEVTASGWQNRSDCWKAVNKACELIDAGVLPEARRRDLEQTADYWLQDFPSLASRTRSIVVSTFTAKVAGLLRSPIRNLFFEESNPQYAPHAAFAGPTDSRTGNRIIIVNVPVKTHGEVGRFCQVLYKTIWQRAADRRAAVLRMDENELQRQVGAGTITSEAASSKGSAFLWADESQYFVTHEDMLFQQTARTSRVATVYLTQNIGNYEVAFGPKSGSSYVNSLLGNLQTKIFHANGDPATNAFAESVFAKCWRRVATETTSRGDTIQDGGVSVNSGMSRQSSPQHVSVVEAGEFTTLASGGTRFDGRICAWIFQPSRNWKPSDGKGRFPNAVFHTFEQYI